MARTREVPAAAILAIERPHPNLWTYYLLSAIPSFIFFPVVALVMRFKYQTLRYRFTDEGVSMSWGILFRRETIINYARIQDIHLRSNLVERWLGLARILVQTASGSSEAEMTIEGLQDFEAVRDFLYARMRGVEDRGHRKLETARTSPGADVVDAEAAETLLQIAAELREIRRLIEERPRSGAGGSDGV